MDYFTSDLHFNHSKDFIFRKRGFSSIEEMEKTYIENFTDTLKENDTLYLLGDLVMGTNLESITPILSLPCRKKIILGNHDTLKRIEFYKSFFYTEIVGYSTIYKNGGKSYYLSHYPTLTGNAEKSQKTYNLFGHTHQEDKFFENNYFMYNVGVDAHNGFPVSIKTIREDIKQKKEQLRKEKESTMLKEKIKLKSLLKATELVKLCNKTENPCYLSRGKITINGKSLLGVISIDVTQPFDFEYSKQDFNLFRDFLNKNNII